MRRIEVTTDEVKITRSLELSKEQKKKYDGSVDGEIVAFCDLESSPLIEDIALARDLRNRVQMARKEHKLVPTDKVDIFISAKFAKEEKEGEIEIYRILNSDVQEVQNAFGLKVQIGEPEGLVSESEIGEYLVKVTIVKH